MPERPPNLSPHAFTGTAHDYLRYRVPYPPALLNDLAARAAITGNGRLIDLACGPGRIALDLAPRFRDVWALDLEPEMIAVGATEATRRGLANIRWIVGRAEELDAPAGTVELITIGEAFHRLDQPLIAARALAWLTHGGGLAVLGGWGPLVGDTPWQKAAREVARRFATYQSPADGPVSTEVDGQIETLRRHGFTHIIQRDFPVAYDWTRAAIAGYLYSTSYCSKTELGARGPAFESELTAALLKAEPSGRFHQQTTFGYTLATRHERTA